MITGTLYEAGKMMTMQNKWEQKKSTGNVLKKDKKELTPEEKQLPSVAFAEIPAKDIMTSDEPTAVVIKTKKSTIEIPTNIPASLMIRIVKAVAHAL